MPYGTIQNPLMVQPGAVMRDEQEAMRMQALADQLASQQLQAGPNTALNILTPFLQQFAANRQAKKAGELIEKSTNNRFQLESQAELAREERELLRGEKLAQARREAWLKAHPGDTAGAEHVAMFGKPPPQQKAGNVNEAQLALLAASGDANAKAALDNLVQQRTRIAEASRAPAAARQPTDMEAKIAYLTKQGVPPEQINAMLLGPSAAPRPKQMSPKDKVALEQKGAAITSLEQSAQNAIGLLDKGLDTGPLAGIPSKLLGIETPADQEYKAEIGTMASELRKLQKVPGSGADSDKELELLLNQLPTLSTDEGAAKNIIARLVEKSKLYGAASGLGAQAPAGGDGWSIEPLD